MNQLYVYMFFLRFFSIIGYYKILSIVPCAKQQVLVVYLFYRQQCVYVNPKLLIYPPERKHFLKKTQTTVLTNLLFPNTWTNLKNKINMSESMKYFSIVLSPSSKLSFSFSFIDRGNTKNIEGMGGMNWEIGIDTYTLICIKQISNENLLYSTGNSTSLYSRN